MTDHDTTPDPQLPTADEPGPLVVGRDLACTFGVGETAVVALYDAWVDVRPDDRIAVTGPSGSGKSTLLHVMAGLQPITAGTIDWPGLGGHPRRGPGRVGVIFQGPSLLPALDVIENVTLPLLFADTEPDEADARAWDSLHAVGIAALARRVPDELSGGQAQRVAIARTLAARPRLVLADEPTGQLDHHTASTVMSTLLESCDHLQAGLVVATHDPAVADRLGTRWIMRDGHIVSGSGPVGR